MVRLVAALLMTGLAACGPAERIVVGSNDFAEQKLLAEIMAITLEERGFKVERRIPSGDNRTNLIALQSGQLDVYPAYDGTLASLIDRPDPDGIVASRPSAANLASGMGLEWLAPFGFRNDFAVAVRLDTAIRDKLETIGDLATLDRPLRFAADNGYVARPVDGLRALARRYGLPLADTVPIPLRDRSAAYEALLNRRADAAIVFTADAQASSFGMRLLIDDLGFFPAYRAAPLASAAALAANPAMRDAMAELEGRLPDDVLRELVYRIDFRGDDYRDVAHEFLRSIGELEALRVTAGERTTLRLAVEPVAGNDEMAVRAFRALREVMPARPVSVDAYTDPVFALKSNKARYALLGADAFFRLDGDGQLRRVAGIEAIAVAGAHYLHVVSLANAPQLGTLAELRVATGAQGGSSYRVAAMLAAELDDRRVTLVPIEQASMRAAALRSGDVDLALLMGSAGHAGLVSQLDSDPALQLRSIEQVVSAAVALRYPFLRPARIPANTYPRQPEPVDTLSVQAVLAAAFPPPEAIPGAAGPMSVPGIGEASRERVQPRTAAALQLALGQGEAVDPVLPRSPGLVPGLPETDTPVRFQPAFALINILAILFLAWVASLYFRPLPAQPALRPVPKRQASRRQE